jgi:hypothetical protein
MRELESRGLGIAAISAAVLLCDVSAAQSDDAPLEPPGAPPAAAPPAAAPPAAAPPAAAPPAAAPPGQPPYGSPPYGAPPGQPGYGPPPPGYGPPGQPGAHPYPPPGYYPYPPPYYYPPGGTYPDLRPRTIPYNEGDAPPAGYRLDTRMMRGLIIAGATTFGSLYLLSAAVGSAFLEDSRNNDGHAPLFIPVVGPFITIGTANPSPMGTFALVIDGLGQAAGVAMFVAGLTVKTKIWVREGKGEISVAPIVAAGPGGLPGVGFEGRF